MSDDRVLISRITEGDMGAFRHLINQHEKLVIHMIGRVVRSPEDMEELCQDVFLKVYEKINAFNHQSKLSTWIATIAYRQAINHLRKKRIAISEVNDDDFRDRFIAEDNPSQQLEEDDIEQKIMTYIDELPVHYRTVITLYHLEGMNYIEIGKITGMPEGTVKNYLFRARRLLKDKIKAQLKPEEWI